MIQIPQKNRFFLGIVAGRFEKARLGTLDFTDFHRVITTVFRHLDNLTGHAGAEFADKFIAGDVVIFLELKADAFVEFGSGTGIIFKRWRFEGARNWI